MFVSLAWPLKASQTPAVLPGPGWVGATPPQCSGSSVDPGPPQSVHANTSLLKVQTEHGTEQIHVKLKSLLKIRTGSLLCEALTILTGTPSQVH